MESSSLENAFYDILTSEGNIFKLIVESSADGLWCQDLISSTNNFWASAKFWNSLGYDEGEIQSFSHLKKIIYPQDLEVIIDAKNKHLLNPEIPYDHTCRWHHKNGTTFWFRSRGFLYRDKDGNPDKLIGTFADVTRLKEKEALLEQKRFEISQAKSELNLFFNNANDLIQSIDENGDFAYVNEAWKRKMGYNDDEISQIKIFDIIYPVDLPEFREHFHKQFKGKKAKEIFLRYHNKNGEVIYLEGNMNFVEDKRGVLANTILRDVTQKVNTEKELLRNKEMLEETNQVAKIGGWDYDPVSKELLWTSVTKEIHEVDNDYNPTLEQSVQFFKKGKNRSRISEVLNMAIRDGLSFDEELQITTKSGKTRWVKVIGKCGVSGKKVLRVYGTLQDITQQKAQEKQLRVAKKQAETANRAKSDFLSSMSHEIRTPLNSVIGFSELMMQSSLSADQKVFMESIYNSGNSLLDLINDILDFSKIESGKMELNIDKTDIWTLTSKLLDIMQVKIRDKDVEFIVNISPDIPRYIWVDHVRIRQVIINLLGNATKFTNKGQIELGINMVKIHGENALMEFSVSDTGIGISENKQKEIFKAFTQADATVSRDFGGTGLGLAISNQLLDLMKSRLSLDSTPGDGSRFYFQLECKVEKDTEHNEFYSLKNILIVDDNKQNRDIISSLLNSKGISSQSAENGLQAYKLLESNNYDAIILDYHLPYLNGLEVARYIRKELGISSSAMPILMMNKDEVDKNLELAIKELEINHVLKKPVTILKLREALVKLTEFTLNHKVQKEEKENENIFSERYCSIMIVDDNDMNRLLAKTMVSKVLPECTIKLFENGLDAIESVKSCKPDLILMDVQMPKMNGIEATKYIRKIYNKEELPILALSAGVVKEEKEKCINAGMNEFLAKPVLFKDIYDAFRVFLPKNNATRPSFNFEKLLEKLDNDIDAVDQLLQMVKNGALNKIHKQILEYFQINQHHHNIKSLAHSLKGSSSAACMEPLRTLSEQLEVSIDPKEKCRLISEIGDELKNIDKEIQSYEDNELLKQL